MQHLSGVRKVSQCPVIDEVSPKVKDEYVGRQEYRQNNNEDLIVFVYSLMKILGRLQRHEQKHQDRNDENITGDRKIHPHTAYESPYCFCAGKCWMICFVEQEKYCPPKGKE